MSLQIGLGECFHLADPSARIGLVLAQTECSTDTGSKGLEALTLVDKRLALDAALQLAGASGAQPDVQFAPAAAPLCTAPWVLSLSHSGPWLATAAAKGPGIAVGVDVEQHKPR
ncbi:MAG: hypothetical protein ACR2PZ_01320, partial [Pseudomonadales bacterium]